MHLALDSDRKIYLNSKVIHCCPRQIQKHHFYLYLTVFIYPESQNEKHLSSDSFGHPQYYCKSESFKYTQGCTGLHRSCNLITIKHMLKQCETPISIVDLFSVVGQSPVHVSACTDVLLLLILPILR